MLKAHQQERVPATPLVVAHVSARTVLAGKGSLRRAKSRRALARSAPFRRTRLCDERLRREHFTAYLPHPNLQNLTYTTFRAFIPRMNWISHLGADTSRRADNLHVLAYAMA